MKNLTRRDFIRKSAALGTSACCAQALHGVLGSSIVQAQTPAGSGKKLVILNLNGGNDCANVEIAMNNGAYFSSRPNIAIPFGNILSASGGWGYHPALANIRARFLQGHVADIPGGGPPNPTRSHEEDTRQFALANGKTGGPGWVGAAFDQYVELNGTSGLGIYNSVALGNPGSASAVLGCARADKRNLSFSNLPTTLGTDNTGSNATNSRIESHKGLLDSLSYLQTRRTNAKLAYRNMYDQLAALNAAITAFPGSSTVAYGNSGIGNRLRQVAAIIAAESSLGGSQTQAFIVEIGGFDTHATQVVQGAPTTGGHATLWSQIDTAVGRFMNDMELGAINRANDVAILIYSEFGRTAKENGSVGTDHGHGGTVMVLGSSVVGGFRVSPWASSVFTSNANVLPVSVHIQNVYREILENWLQLPVPPLQSHTHADLNLFS